MAFSPQLLLLATVLASSIVYPHSLLSNELEEHQNVLAIDSDHSLQFQMLCPIEPHASIILYLEEHSLGKRIEIVYNTRVNARFSSNAGKTQINGCLLGMNHNVDLSFKQIDRFDVHTLRLTDNNRCIKIKNWPIGILSVLTLLTDITAHHCNRHSLNMQNLSLAHNAIVIIPSDIFQMQADLINLDLSYNEIAALDDDLFGGLEKLQVLRLSHNRLIDISR